MESLRKFCDTLDPKYLENLPEIYKKIMVRYSFQALWEKTGKLDISRLILQKFGQIKTIEDTYVIKERKRGQEREVEKTLKFDVYTGTHDLSPLDSLIAIGVATIPVISPEDLPGIREKFVKTLRGFPGYNRDPENQDFDSSGHRLDYVLGGFGALGNPASFHNPLVRWLRILGYDELVEKIFRLMINKRFSKDQRENMKIEMLFDRMMYRIASQKPGAEAWHRDVMPPHYIRQEDEVFGGWLNLDTNNQYFSCIPGSHLGIFQRDLEPGFATIDKEKVKMVGQYKHRFTIPPGHLVIFPQYIIHEVVANAAKYDMMRLFYGWRLTLANSTLRPEIPEEMDRQAVMRLPGGMIPPMYAKNHLNFFLRKPFRPIPNRSHKVNLIEWSRDTMKPETLVEKHGKDGDYLIVRRHMLSLEEYRFPLYPPYTEEEKVYYKPHRV
jgi:hypothetical protein